MGCPPPELRVLTFAQHGVDMNTRLLTPDGFPRADIDVAQSKSVSLVQRLSIH